MNILHLMKDYKPTIGGSVVRNGSMIDSYHIQYTDDNIYLIDLDGDKYQQESDENGVHVIREKSLRRLIKVARRLIISEHIDIIHAHNFRFLYAAFISRIGISKKPQIVFEIHAMYNMEAYKELIGNHLMKRTERIIVLAECAKRYLINERGIDEQKVTVVRNGIDECIEATEIKDKHLIDEITCIREKYVLTAYTGSFIEWQGVRFVAENFDKILGECNNIALLMIGNGSDYDYVIDKREKSKYKERIIIHSGILKQEMNELYKHIDILLIPRVKNLSTNTAVPLKAIEAMRYGKCILAANDNGLLEVLDDTNSICFESENIEMLVEKLKLLQCDSGMRFTLASKAERDAKDLFVSWREVSSIVHSLYEGDS